MDVLTQIPSPLFKRLTREVYLVWNPRIIRLKPTAARVRDWLLSQIRF